MLKRPTSSFAALAALALSDLLNLQVAETRGLVDAPPLTPWRGFVKHPSPPAPRLWAYWVAAGDPLALASPPHRQLRHPSSCLALGQSRIPD